MSVNGVKITKASYLVKVDDVLTFNISEWDRIIEVAYIGNRRGPAPQAQALYRDRSGLPPVREKRLVNPKYEGKGRPTGKQRRELSSFSKRGLD